jgi:competence protein ComEC
MTLGKSKIFLLCCLSFMIGVAVHSFNEDWNEYELIWFFLAVLFLLATIIFWRNFRARIVFLMVLFLFSGIWRYSLAVPDISPTDISFYNGRQVKMKGIVCGEPETEVDSQQFRLCGETLNARPVTGEVLVTAGRYPEYNYGDPVMLKGELEEPKPFDGFDYDKYLAKQGIYSTLYYPDIRVLSSDSKALKWSQQLYGGILDFRQGSRSKMNRGLEEPASTLAGAMLLGYKGAIPEGLRKDFSRAGLSHIIAISGLHIGILVVLIFYLLLAAGSYRNQAFYASSLALLFYIILVGSPVSAVRAGLMGFLALLAARMGRLPKAERFLIISAFVILLVNPMLLRYDVGFQLSFLAVGAILFFYPAVRSMIPERARGNELPRTWRAVTEILILSFVIQLFIAPIVAYNFGVISFMAPIANLLVLWTLPFVISLLIVSTVVSTLVLIVWGGGAEFIFYPAKLFLSYILWIGEMINNIPFSSWKVENVEPIWIIIYYIFVALIFLGIRRINIGFNRF